MDMRSQVNVNQLDRDMRWMSALLGSERNERLLVSARQGCRTLLGSALLAAMVLLVGGRAFAQPLSMTVSATPDPVAPGAAYTYRIVLANPSTNTPTGAFTLNAAIPEHVTATQAVPGSGSCGTCRYGAVVPWNVASLGPGESTVLRFNAIVDNSSANPAPADGTVLSADITANVGGTTVTKTATVVVQS